MVGSGFSLKRIAFNALSISGGEVANKASTFFVYAAVSRICGLEAFGQLSLGLTLLYTCHVFGYAGLPTVLIRLIAGRPKSARRYLLHGSVAAAMTSTLAALIMVAIAFAMSYQAQTTQVICLLALAVPFYSLTMIAEAVIKGREKMHLIALGNVPGNVTLVLGSLLVLKAGLGVLGVAVVVVVARLITLAILNWLARQASVDCQRPSRFHFSLVVRLLSRARIFLGSDGVAAVGASLFGLMLSKFASEREVGMLSAAFQLLQPIQILYRSFGHSSFPPLVAAAKSGKAAVADLSHRVLSLIVRLAFPACLTMFTLAADLLDLVYGHKGFRDGAYVLQIVAFSLLFDPLNPILGHGMWAVGADKSVFRIVVTNVTVNLLLGIVLIGTFGLPGAAICALVASFINTSQHYYMFSRQVGSPNLLGEVLRLAPAIVTALIIIIFTPWSRWICLPIALTLYGLITLMFNNSPSNFLNLLARPSTHKKL